MLPNHPNLIKFYGGEFVQIQGTTVALFLLELCDGGTLFDLLVKHQQSRFKEN